MEYENAVQLAEMTDGMLETIGAYEMFEINYETFVKRMKHYTILVDVINQEIKNDLPND